MKKYILILIISIAAISCQKEEAQRVGPACYACLNIQNDTLQIICADSEAEAQQKFTDSTNCWNGVCPPTAQQFTAFCHLQD